MAICRTCGQDMLEASSCTLERYNDFVDGQERERIRFGQERHRALIEQFVHSGASSDLPGTEGIAGRGPLSREEAERAVAAWQQYLAREHPDRRCHDCAVRVGGFHHPGCDVEECPRCGYQALSCECVAQLDELEDPRDYHPARNLPAEWKTSREEAMRRISEAGAEDQ